MLKWNAFKASSAGLQGKYHRASLVLDRCKDILIYFLAFLPCVLASPAAADGPTGMIFGMWVCTSIFITYISVSKSTPLAVTGPHGQLASMLFYGSDKMNICL